MNAPDETAGNRLGAELDELAAATDRLLRTVDDLTDDDLRAPSLLPGWSRAHVLTHIARNADGLGNLVEAARTGDGRPMYPGGTAGRDADIEAGAARHIGDLRLDVAESADRFMAAFADFPDEGLDRVVAFSSGATALGRDIPLRRVREVEIHHVDLGLGYTPDDWTPEFATRTLGQIAPGFRTRDCPVGLLVATDGDGRWELAADGPQLSGPRTALLAWLTGRTAGDGLEISPTGEVPRAPRWA